MTADDETLDLSSSITDEIAGIVSIRYSESSTHRYRLIRDDLRNHEWYTFSASGTPSHYSRIDQDNIEFNVASSSASHTIRVYYWKKPTISTTDPAGHTLLIPVEWEELLTWETLYRTYHFLQDFQKAQMLMLPSMEQPGPTVGKKHSKEMGIIPRLWNDLLLTLNWRESIDEDWGMQPYRRGM